jgi:hypothetical protein
MTHQMVEVATTAMIFLQATIQFREIPIWKSPNLILLRLRGTEDHNLDPATVLGV